MASPNPRESRVSPFRGMGYDPARIGDISRVVAPPYDMISAEAQRQLYERDEHNFVRLILGHQFPDDGPENNRYTRAARDFAEWQRQAILVRDDRPSIYVYEQEYSLPRRPRLSRRGFIALARLEELGKGSIHPHERTMSGPKEDRLNLMLACKANFSQVFSVYDDPKAEIDGILGESLPAKPRFDFTDTSGVRHILYPVTGRAAIAGVQRLMEDESLFIADGHHRYETALNFRGIMRQKLGRRTPSSYDHVMMYFANMASPGLTILPFHRLVSLPEGVSAARAVGSLGSLGEVRTVPAAAERLETLTRMLEEMARAGTDEHRFGIYAPPSFHLLSVRHEAAGTGNSPVDALDVSLLHQVVLERALGTAPPGADISYVTGEQEILEQMDQRPGRIAFFLNPTKVEQVRDVAASGLRMPPKSTNFQPKLISGLVFNLLD